MRLALQLSGVEWVDNRVPGKDWGSIKPSTPWGKMPMLELADGAKLSQQRALLRFVGKLGGLSPDDPLLAARRRFGALCLGRLRRAGERRVS